jgi:hypothetical protein
MNPTLERQNMMLTKTEKRDIAHDDHVFVFNIEESFVEDAGNINIIARGKKLEAFDVTIRGFEKTVTAWVFAKVF